MMIQELNRHVERCLVAALVLLLTCSSLVAGDWPQWRGPTGQGFVDDANLPTTWDGKTGENIVWKAALPKGDTPYSSPIVRGDRVFITVAMNKTREHHVLCFDKKEGTLLWDTSVPPGLWNLTDLRGGYAASTPAADAERVYVLFGSAGLAGLAFYLQIACRIQRPPQGVPLGLWCEPS